ncbi:hypothetical protein KDN24_24790 [Bacillus sp. Bva_UNVM-123]|uniref:hypothetical protein n=1 Tax=Bacillus sp. Bva_UNVM-123 TaxID=2829798 RepID=UPI00391F6C5F
MEEFELPLVFFTVFSQWAVGIVLVITLLEWIKPEYLEKYKIEIFRKPAFNRISTCCHCYSHFNAAFRLSV